MKITKISRTVSFGNYENISLTGELEEGDGVMGALVELEAEIKRALDKRDEFFNAISTIDGHQGTIIQLSKEVNDLQIKKSKICAWAEKHNIQDVAFDDLPF